MPSIAGCDKLSELVSDFEMAVMVSAEKMAASFNEETASAKKDLHSSKDITAGTVSKEKLDFGSELNVIDSRKRTKKPNDVNNMKIDSEKKETVVPMEIDDEPENSKAKEEPPNECSPCPRNKSTRTRWQRIACRHLARVFTTNFSHFSN
jgi:hypothetical protein